ncbi:aminodeoxychorismate synthase, component I [bacterium Unc6]|nr:aminodeoxychorismate synthase, component I [bacterium Unc6]
MIKYLKYIPPEYVAQKLKTMDGFLWLDSSLSCSYGRLSFIAVEPFLKFTCKKTRVEIREKKHFKVFDGEPLETLRNLLKKYKAKYKGIPFYGGAAGFLSYDLCHQIENLPDISKDDMEIPDIYLGFYDIVLGWDNLKKKFWIVNAGFSQHSEEQFKRIIDVVIKQEKPFFKKTMATGKKTKNLISCFTKTDYIKSIEKLKEYIYAGDVYQVNLSQRLHCKTDKEPFEIYSILRNVNSAPYSAYIEHLDFQVLSSSPECFLIYNPETRILQTRPIKGTLPRGKNEKQDKMLAKKLTRSAKDRAEHIMIVDLERNDLGRVCENKSVRVKKNMEVEKYAKVWHLVSTVQGKVKKNCDRIDILKATFPGGSITGAPKIRSMQIIEEMEPFKRGIYTGSIGYLGFSGDMELSIAIRTMITKNNKIYFSVGGGIVADSKPYLEYKETFYKAEAMIKAI